MKLLKYISRACNNFVIVKKLCLDKDVQKIFLLFIFWKFFLILVSFLSLKFLALRGKDFFGGGFEAYIKTPLFYGWANFDGEHYLSIAQVGYRSLEQAFFPVYPILINFFAKPFGGTMENLVVSGLLISNVSFLAALIVLFKLIILDYPKKIAYFTVLLLLLFPTSFYFGALYSESLFLLLTVASFYLIRKGYWFFASLLGVFSSATRIFGVLLVPAFLLEASEKKLKVNKFVFTFLIPTGLLAYMYYQWINYGDPLAFYHLQKIVGPQHESGITLLPQIYYRYIKMMLTTPFSNPIYSTIILEFIVGILFFILPILGFLRKMKASYLFYAFAGFILPTIQGSFSSVPRYVIVLFPAFLIMSILLESFKKPVKIAILFLSGICLIIETALFFRGYWVA
ncbi:hypothetical protein A2769_00180 [Candidatus Daviesbacteria bacterium RIFCSPHIGHO2_01_FULL_37_27]|nr:MAG: hypothetical protein A2769_00180 [Candidatus Daviesbacteria bacterium RIFCSPHIGHO2_01_FULL_37_27]OGE46093.1 MAG: hypothetical protein A3B39_00790 [Candidatus Daviesbacteria bacterium RIFCSPLOWO2_01_FULL_37_10]